jgi:uncharacterized protein YegJ (DUF2314 family)
MIVDTMFDNYDFRLCSFAELQGRIPIYIKVDKNPDKKNNILMLFSDGVLVKMHHQQDCCESVWIEDICGDMDDLIGYPLIVAEEVSNKGTSQDCDQYCDDSVTWTYYKMDTVKGGVTIRWCGTSNGYYSESANTEVYVHDGWLTDVLNFCTIGFDASTFKCLFSTYVP